MGFLKTCAPFAMVLCLISSPVFSAPHPYYQMAYYMPYPAEVGQNQPYPVASAAASKSDSGTENPSSLKYAASSPPNAMPEGGYVFAPYYLPYGYFPQTQLNSVYPAGTEPMREERQTVLENIQNFFQNAFSGLVNRPGASEGTGPLGGIFQRPQGGILSGLFNRPNQEAQPINQASPVVPPTPVETPEAPQPVVSNQEEAEAPQEEAVVEENPQPEEMMEPQNEEEEVPAVQPDEDEPIAEVIPSDEIGQTRRSFILRKLARSSFYPVVPKGIPRNVPHVIRKEGEMGEAEGGEDVGEQEEEEEEEDDEDSVVVAPGGTKPSVAQAKPAAIALAGVGGVAAAAPSATAVVGANGLAVAAPSATAIAGPSAGAPPPGLLPKGSYKPKTRRVTAEEAKKNAAQIDAARRSAEYMIYDLSRVSGGPRLPLAAFPVWTGQSFY